MPGVYIGTSELKAAYVGTTPVKEIYVGTTKVRPNGWQPGANTVAYYPLTTTTTVNDKSGNNYTLTQNYGIFTTVDGVECFYYNNGANTYGFLRTSLATLVPSGGDDRTISIWAKAVVTPSSLVGVIKYGADTVSTVCDIRIRSGGQYRAGGRGTINGPNVTPNKWDYLTYVVNGGLFYFYIDGVLIGSATMGNTTAVSSSRPLYLGSRDGYTGTTFPGYLSECIIENKARTAQEISDYYDLTKSNYGF